jgi:mannosyltransferase
MTLPGGRSVARKPEGPGQVTTERTIPQQRPSAAFTAQDISPLADLPGTGQPGGEQPGGDRPGARRRRGPAWLTAAPAVVTLLVVCWQIQRPSYWRDEGATLSAVTRPPGALVRMLAHADAVHGAYYLFMWAVVHIGGTGEVVTRLPSALAMAAAAAMVALTGRELISPWAGLLAGLLFAALPEVSRYGQEARSYAIVTALAATASYFLVRALNAGTEPASPAGPSGPAGHQVRHRWLAAYGLALTVLGLVNFFALTLIPAHALTVWLARRPAHRPGRPAGAPAGGPAASSSGQTRGRPPRTGWLTAAAVAVVVASPVVWFAWQQRNAQGWLKSPGLDMLVKLHFLVGSVFLLGFLALIVAVSVTRTGRAGRGQVRACWPGPFVALCVPWLLLPPAILISASLIQPVYTLRYILFCLPAVALIGGAGLATLGRWVGPVALALIVVLALPGQIVARHTAAHGDNVRLADREVAAAYRPGDAVLYVSRDARYMAAAYPYGLSELRNIWLASGKIPSGTLAGTYLPRPVIHQRLARLHRVWVVAVGIHPLAQLPLLHGLHFRLVRQYHPSDIWLLLYWHQVLPPSQPAQPPRPTAEPRPAP